jgi:hypothetical protein
MQKYLTGASDDGTNGLWDNGVQRHAGLESGAFDLFCLLAFLMVTPVVRENHRKSQ